MCVGRIQSMIMVSDLLECLLVRREVSALFCGFPVATLVHEAPQGESKIRVYGKNGGSKLSPRTDRMVCGNGGGP